MSTLLTTLEQAAAAHAARVFIGAGVDEALSGIRTVLEAAITGHARSQQTMIGPSEVGTPCLLCLGRKLAGIPERRDVAWLPTIGTAVHAWAEDAVLEHNRVLAPDVEPELLPEMRVHVGNIDGAQCWGTADLFHVPSGTVIDYKVVGKTTLNTVRTKGASETYRVQAHLYGRGMAALGYPVRHVAIWYLPRNAPSMSGGTVWTQAWDESVALAGLARADALAKAIRLAGADVVLASLAAEPGCYSCTRFDDGRGPVARNPFAGLVGS